LYFLFRLLLILISMRQEIIFEQVESLDHVPNPFFIDFIMALLCVGEFWLDTR
jgi:hypothetical protein